MDDEEFKLREAELALKEATLQLKKLQEMSIRDGLNRTAEPPLCSFCGKGINQVRRMIEGQRGHICDSCIRACGELIQDPGTSSRP